MYFELNDENIWKSEWGGDIFFLYGLIYSRGVCILLNFLLNCVVRNFYKD